MIDLVPLSEFSERIARGWKMVPGYPLQPGDYAVTMKAPAFEEKQSNLSKAAVWRNKLGAEKRHQAARRRLNSSASA